jgi:putative NADH-flavin reductase
MKIAIVGATGRTGRDITRLALAAGHTVTAVVRNASKLGDLHPHAVAVTEATNVDGLARAFANVDAVLFAIGPVQNESKTIQSDAAVATLEAMHRARVGRIIAISASGPFYEGDDPLSRYVAKPILWRVFHNEWADISAMDGHIRASNTKWTILRPPRLLDGPGRGRYRIRKDGNVRWGFSVHRADLAQAMLDALIDPSTAGGTISISN